MFLFFQYTNLLIMILFIDFSTLLKFFGTTVGNRVSFYQLQLLLE